MGAMLPMPDLMVFLKKRARHHRVRCTKGSHHRVRALLRVAKAYRAIHKAMTNGYTRPGDVHAVVCTADLHMQDMTWSAHGSVAKPGTHVAPKHGRNRSLQRSGPEVHVTAMQVKKETGHLSRHTRTVRGQSTIVLSNFMVPSGYGRVPRCNLQGISRQPTPGPQYTSQKCHNCGVIRKANRKSQSVYHCSECDVEKNADVNAALNIRDKWLSGNMAFGDGATAGGGGSVGWPVKPENVSGASSRPAGVV